MAHKRSNRNTPERFIRRALLIGGMACLIFGLFLLVIGRINDHFFATLNRDIAAPDTPAEERVLRTFVRVSDWQYFDASRIASPVYRLLARAEHASPFHLSARSTLTGGVDLIGPCGSLTRSMLVLLKNAGIPARKLILYDTTGTGVHTVVEVFLDAEWRVFDPTYSWYWRRLADGKIATVADLKADPALFATIVTRHPEYPLDRYTYDNVHHLRWERLPGLPGVQALLQRWRGAAWVRSIRTPYLYERPTYMFGLFLLVAAAGCFGLRAWVSHRPGTRVVAASDLHGAPGTVRPTHV